MRSPVLRGTFLLLLGLWFGVFVPSHERGRIAVPGADARPSNNGCCHANRPAASVCSSGDRPSIPAKQDSSPTDKPIPRCAVCYIVATLQTPAAVLFYEPATDWIEWLSTPIVDSIAGVQPLQTRYDRGPPPIDQASGV